MAWLSTYNTPSILDVSYNETYKNIELSHPDWNLRSVIYLKLPNESNDVALEFLYKFRTVIEDAIDHHLKLKEEQKECNDTQRGLTRGVVETPVEPGAETRD